MFLHFSFTGLSFSSPLDSTISSIAFHSGRHMWKARMYGNIVKGFSFGIINVKPSRPGQLNLGNW